MLVEIVNAALDIPFPIFEHISACENRSVARSVDLSHKTASDIPTDVLTELRGATYFCILRT
eukprot:6197239-Pleurochrysis_carterae.AAC.1